MKEILNLLLEKKTNEPTLSNNVKFLINTYDNSQLLYMLQNGMKISEDLVLFYYNNIGFRCINTNANIIGNKPICGVIERFLNNNL